MEAVKKTSKDWVNGIHKDCKLKVIDPDGWDRENFDFSFNKELITKEEFKTRLLSSTISCRNIYEMRNL